MSCDVERGLLGQTASPDAAASTVVAVTSGQGLATVLLASSELTAAQVVRVGIMGRTVQRCAPAGREGSATQPPGGVSVLPVEWDSPASKHARGGATACSAETRVAVRTGPCATLLTGLVNADWAGPDPAVAQPVCRENTGSIVHKTVLASTMGPATVLPAPAAVLLDTMATPVNTDVRLGSLE